MGDMLPYREHTYIGCLEVGTAIEGVQKAPKAGEQQP